MRYAGIDKCDICNGNDVGVSVYVQGCHFHCKGCFNKETWDFDKGKEWDEQVEEYLINLLSKQYIKRLSILGGEPLAEENLPLANHLIQIVTDINLQNNRNIKIWLYTGYKAEDVIRYNSAEYLPSRANAIMMCDFVVDGQFEIDKQDLTYSVVKFAGSTNQRIIDIQKSIEEDQMVLWDGN